MGAEKFLDLCQSSDEAEATAIIIRSYATSTFPIECDADKMKLLTEGKLINNERQILQRPSRDLLVSIVGQCSE